MYIFQWFIAYLHLEFLDGRNWLGLDVIPFSGQTTEPNTQAAQETC